MSNEQMSTTELQIRTLLGELRDNPRVPQHLVDGLAENQRKRLSTPHNLNSSILNRQRLEALSEACLLQGALMAVSFETIAVKVDSLENRIAELEKGPP